YRPRPAGSDRRVARIGDAARHRSRLAAGRGMGAPVRLAAYRTALTSAPDVLRGLEDLASSAGTTVEIVTFAIARLLLHVYTAQDDALLGTSIATGDDPFSLLVERGKLARDPAADDAAGLGGQLELVPRVVRSPDELRLDVRYDPALFDEGTVARMA